MRAENRRRRRRAHFYEFSSQEHRNCPWANPLVSMNPITALYPLLPIILFMRAFIHRHIWLQRINFLGSTHPSICSTPTIPQQQIFLFSRLISIQSPHPSTLHHPSVPRFIICLLFSPLQRPFIFPHPIATPTKVFILVGIPLYSWH